MSADTHEISAAHTRADLERASARAARRRATRLQLRLAPQLRATAELAKDLAEAASALTDLEELVLIHPSSAFGFLASTLQLRLPGVKVRALDAEMTGTAATPTAQAYSDIEATPQAGSATESAIVRLSADSGGAEAREALLRLGDATACAVVFDAAGRPRRACVDGLVEAIASMPELREITLVHDSVSIGFLASSLSLRAPNVVVRTSTRCDAGLE